MADRPRDIVVIIADSLRWDSVQGGDGPRLPYITAHATEFVNARAAGCWTLPATASMFTGLSPHEHGADTQSRGLDPSVPTLAERLRERGYSTHQVTANVATTHIFGLHRGFDEIVEIWREVPPQHPKLNELVVLIGKPRLRRRLVSTDWIRGRLAEDISASRVWLQDTIHDVFDRARKILADNQRKGRPTFLFLNLMETHFPYHVDPELTTTGTNLAENLAEILGLYHIVNQTFMATGKDPISVETMRRLRRRQRVAWERVAPTIDAFARELHENTDNLVVFGSDHGDCFGEDGWSYHFSNVTDGGNRVPLYWLSNRVGAQRVMTPVSARDVYHGVMHELGAGDWHPAHAPERSATFLQSAWYNSQGRTIKKYRYNQACIVEGGMRYLRRNGEWSVAPESTVRGEPAFAPLPRSVDPIEELKVDRERKTQWRRLVTDFEAYSTRIAP